MSRNEPILIVGASAAGVSCARTLRALGCAEPIVLIDADPHWPYERPPLSKQMIGEHAAKAADYPLLTQADAAALSIDLHLGKRVSAVSAAGLSVTMENGGKLAGRVILLATGGRALRLRLPGASLPGVHVIRSLADALALRADLENAQDVAVVGGGLIGTEAAVAMARPGRKITWIDAAARPLAHILAEPIADALIASHTRAGVTLRVNARIERFAETDGRVCGVMFADGEILPAQLVVLGVGMVPQDDLARAAGLDVSAGVHVDPLQRTSAHGIFAAGDVASFSDAATPSRKRHEHWQAATQQGANAARAMLGLDPLPAGPAWFWSDQGRHHVEMAGRRTGDSVVRRTERGISVFEFDRETIAGVASLDDPAAVRIGMRLMAAGQTPDRRMLADPATDLKQLLRQPVGRGKEALLF